ncbi:AsmA family protein [Hyphomonas sp.]|uniref:AsmA family protein n=1 Tax=Hyphomonas sp. TaxID=87 RepID=UPI00391BCF2E
MTTKRIALISAAIAGLLIAALLTVPFLVPKSVYRAQIERAATQALQRDVVLSGDVRLSVFPQIAASVGGVTVANPQGFDGPYMIQAGELRGSVRLLPLLSGRVEVRELAFVDASVSLQRLEDGSTNWVFGDPAPPAERPPAPAPSETPAAPRSFNGGVEQARLTNAMLAYRDAQTGEYYELRDLNLQASMPAPNSPFRIRAKGIFQANPFELSANIETLDALLGNKPADIRAELETAFAKVRYDGSVTLGDVPLLDGTFNASSQALPALAALTGADIPYDLAKLGRINLEGAVSGPADQLRIDIRRLTQTSDLMRTSFNGDVLLGEEPSIDGKLTLDVPNLAALAQFAALEMPLNLAPLGRGDIAASITGSLLAPGLTFEKLNVKGSLIDAGYTGTVTLGEVPALAGRFSFRSNRMGELARQLGLDLPAAAALERVDLSAIITGPADALALSNLDFKHEGSLLKAAYTGSASLGGDGALNGQMSASSAKLRNLLAAADVALEPGSTLQTFDASAAVQGSFTQLTFSNLDLKLDKISARGTAGLDLTGERPKLTGRLDMGALDLSPFLAPADQAPKQPQPLEAWSKDKLDLAGLTAADADLQITTSRLTLGSVVLTDAALTAALDNGRLQADLSRFTAFGGRWAGQLSVDASQPVPAFAFNMDGSSVAISSLLGTLAGFDRLTGTGAFKVDATARGTSIDEIIRGLNGNLSTNLNEGALKGLNVTQLVRSAQSLQQAVTTGNYSQLDFRGVLSPAAETEFTSFNTVLSMRNGVANVDILKLLNPVLGVDGTGRIDLGGQSLDIKLATAIDRTGQGQGATLQLAGIPVPVQISGNWNALRVTPDFSGVQSALQAELAGRLQQEITGRTGDVAGSIIGGIIGGGQPQAPTQTPDSPDGTETPATPPRSPQSQIEDAAERAAREALGNLLGRRPPAQQPAPQPAQPAETQPEPEGE